MSRGSWSLRTKARLGAALAALGPAIVAVGPAAALDVRVRGGARLAGQAVFLEDKSTLELRATLTDDDGAPLERAWLELTSTAPFSARDVGGCPTPRVSIAPLDGGVRVQTAARGEICLRLAGGAPIGELRLRFPGHAHHTAATASVAFDRDATRKRRAAVTFDPPPTEIDLDLRTTVIAARVDIEDALSLGDPLVVRLFSDGERELATAKIGGDKKARFEIASDRLGPPGLGELSARFDGDGAFARASDEATVTRFRTVRLELEREPEAVVRGGIAALHVRAAAFDVVAVGAVEALASGASVASVPLRDGRAVLEVPVDPGALGEAAITLRFLPASPYLRAGRALDVRVAVSPPSAVLRTTLLALVIRTLAWALSGWKRSRERPAPAAPPARALPPGVHVLEAGHERGDLHGRVVDAHDGVALANVELVVRAPAIDGDGVVARTLSGSDGTFAFGLERGHDTLWLEASVSTHSAVKRHLPSGGRLVVALSTRRRSLLARLVSWTRGAGRPFDRTREPTPAQVMAVAGERDDVRQWAAEVEEAAFGGGELDAATEHAIATREPGAHQSPG